MLAVCLVTFTALRVAEFAGLELGCYCQVKICVSRSILKSIQKYWTRESHSRHRGKSDGSWVRPGIQMEDEKNY
jgi:hypothetical protein